MNKDKKSIAFYTIGCRSNQAETSTLKTLFNKHGFRVSDSLKDTHTVVINTCTVTQKSDTDTRRLVNKIIRLNPNAKIALIGCQAQVQKEQLKKLPHVQWIIGNQEKMNLPDIIAAQAPLSPPVILTPPIIRRSFVMPVVGIDRKYTRANIKIQDGCDCFCSYCEVPYARGPARSRQFQDIINEVKTLVTAGYKEVVLTGIHIGKYAFRGKNLIDVISALEDISGLERIRISSIEPSDILSTLIKKMAHSSKLCRFLHVPIQSANDRVLKIMKRNYKIKKILAFFAQAVDSIPEICIGTDLIVGFPSESDQDFQETYDQMAKSAVHYFHVFSYSDRHLAKSRSFPNKIDTKTIQKRSQLLRKLSLLKREAFYKSKLGSFYDVLFEQKKGNFWKGLTDNYIHVMVSTNQHLANQILNVKLLQVKGQQVIADLVNK